MSTKCLLCDNDAKKNLTNGALEHISCKDCGETVFSYAVLNQISTLSNEEKEKIKEYFQKNANILLEKKQITSDKLKEIILNKE